MSDKETFKQEATEETIICLGCTATQPRDQHFCSECGAPLSSLSTVGPIEHIYAQGHSLRRCVSGRPNKLILIGMWILLLPHILILAFGLIDNPTPVLLFGSVYVILLYRTTSNYFRKRKSPLSQCDEEEPKSVNKAPE